MLLAFGLGAAMQVQAGQTFNFNGNPVRGCPLNGKQYTCDALPKVDWDDRMAIASGYAVHVKTSIAPDWNYGLAMSGTARLTSDGAINLTQINPASVSISGGSFDTPGEFRIGPPVTVTANVTAGTLFLGTGPTFNITGTMVSRGPVTIASAVTINGSVSGTAIAASADVTISGAVTGSGAVSFGSRTVIGGAVSGHSVTGESEVKFRGDVNATTRFILESRGTVNGNVKAADVELRAERSVVTGKVTASGSLVLGSSSIVDGEVDAGQLKLEASSASITGNAYVDFAHLQWAGRVNKLIYCKKGTVAGRCDCVQNDSGWAVNSANGPRCEAAKPPPGALSHFLIEHDGSGRTCTPESVTVKACANQACSELYKDGASVTLMPEKTTVSIGNSGSQSATFTRNSVGRVALALTQNGSTPSFACRNGASTSCDMDFSGGMSFTMSVPHHKAGDSVQATIKAVDVDPKTGQCVAALKGQTKDVQYSCTGGSQDLALGGTPLACASGAARSVKSSFDQQGQAQLALTYQDVARLKLAARFEDAEGNASFTVAPFAFAFTPPTGTIRAGDTFQMPVQAVNKSGGLTPGFDKALGAGVTAPSFAATCAFKGVKGLVSADKTEFTGGKASVGMAWSEVGRMNLDATLTDFLGTGITVSGSTGAACATALASKVGPFIPKYFRVELPATAKTWFYYAGQPIPLVVSAMNAQGVVTSNYPLALDAAETVSLSAFDDEAKVQNPGGGKLVAPALAFTEGKTSIEAEYWPAGTAPISVDKLRFRAGNGKPTATLVTSSGDTAFETARPPVRSGRLRLSNGFGKVGVPVEIGIEAHYWNGASWLFNSNDSDTLLPANAFSQKPGARRGAAPARSAVGGATKLGGGKARVTLTGNRAGWIDLAVNLGPDKIVLPCQPQDYPESTGSAQAWLRLRSGCLDPSARATFGEPAPERKRMIHMREVFN